MTPFEIETAVIGILLTKTKHVAEAVGAGLQPWHFTAAESRLAFEACIEFWKTSETASMHKVAAKIGRQHEPWLKAAREHAPLLQDLGFYIRIMLDSHRASEFHGRLSEIGRAISNRDITESLDGLIAKAAETIFAANIYDQKIKSSGIGAALTESLKDADERFIARRTDASIGVPFGFPTIDQITGGMQKGNVYIIGARTGIGKTTLAINIAVNAAKSGARSAYVTVEMSRRDLADKILCREARVDSMHYLNGDFSQEESDRLTAASRSIAKIPLFMVEAIVPVFDALAMEITRLVQVERVSLVIVDYLQQFELNESKYRSPREVTKSISTGLKTLAKKHQIALLVLSQLSREAPDDGSPDLRHIAESDQIARDADVVMLLYREGSGTFLRIAKQRRGMQGSVLLRSRLEFSLLEEDRAMP